MSASKTGKFGASLANLRSLESLATRDTPLHRISPTIKIAATFAYIVAVVSFGVYDFSGLVPFAAYPIIAASAGEIPYGLLFKRTLIALPFVAFAGTANIIFDRAPVELAFGLKITGGMLSFAVLILKTLLTVSAVLVLAATTPLNAIASGLKRFGLPCILVLQFVMTWRYLEVLIDEAERMFHAYVLRSPDGKFVKFKDWPMMAGQLFLRAYDRAERVYGAMQCRGFDARRIHTHNIRETGGEIFGLILFAAACAALRCFNLSAAVGGIFS